MKDQEYIKLLEGLVGEALDEREKLKGEILALQEHNAELTVETILRKELISMSRNLTFACLQRWRESLFVSQN